MIVPHPPRGGAVRQLTWLITTRSRVRIPPPQRRTSHIGLTRLRAGIVRVDEDVSLVGAPSRRDCVTLIYSHMTCPAGFVETPDRWITGNDSTVVGRTHDSCASTEVTTSGRTPGPCPVARGPGAPHSSASLPTPNL